MSLQLRLTLQNFELLIEVFKNLIELLSIRDGSQAFPQVANNLINEPLLPFPLLLYLSPLFAELFNIQILPVLLVVHVHLNRSECLIGNFLKPVSNFPHRLSLNLSQL
jgi:hypothetical protein